MTWGLISRGREKIIEEAETQVFQKSDEYKESQKWRNRKIGIRGIRYTDYT